ncbi:hypothetical protein [Psychrobacillus lasiicapitis]|uniref:hypothetical protein n=1 Tax=Psychrobacillus lasiicapitis TaxID=1636719 RepID=UPI00147695EE|nr:hypothetical protein [Psychrobacillus lasiicapitis]GGA37407.1 hypothetical protein GCM10011384_28800 [Psychrobacillus lasiicapitis]
MSVSKALPHDVAFLAFVPLGLMRHPNVRLSGGDGVNHGGHLLKPYRAVSLKCATIY